MSWNLGKRTMTTTPHVVSAEELQKSTRYADSQYMQVSSKLRHTIVIVDVAFGSLGMSLPKRMNEANIWESALKLFNIMICLDIPPDNVAFSAAFTAFEEDKQWEKELLLLDDMEAQGIAPDVS